MGVIMGKEKKSLGMHVAVCVAMIGCWAPHVGAVPSQGQVLAAVCAQCHGTDGRAVSSFPSIAGKPAATMYSDLLDKKHRSPEGIMDMQARGYTDEQLWLIAQYYASLPGEGE
jgi:cytochrome c553